MRLPLALLLLLMFITPSVKAGPGPVVGSYMQESVSLFSFGLFRLNDDLHKMFDRVNKSPAFEDRRGFFRVSAYYDWDRDRIEIEVVLMGARRADPDITPAMCAEILNGVRSQGGVDPQTGKLTYSGAKNSSYSSYFAPIGYNTRDVPSDGLSKLDQIIYIKVNIGSPKCEGALLSTDVLLLQAK